MSVLLIFVVCTIFARRNFRDRDFDIVQEFNFAESKATLFQKAIFVSFYIHGFEFTCEILENKSVAKMSTPTVIWAF